MLFLRRASTNGKEHRAHSFIAGLTGGYLVFGRGIQSSVNQQIVIYVFARVMLALAKLSVQRRSKGGVGMGRELREKVRRNAWPVFASLSWAMVMWLYRWYPETIQPSLRSSMKYMYVTHPLPVTCCPEMALKHPLIQPTLQWLLWITCRIGPVLTDSAVLQIC